MASDEGLRHACERKSTDGHQIELNRKLSTICEGAEVRGGFDETIEEFSLPKNIRRLPFFHYTVVTPSAMTPATTNKRLKEIVKEHLGEIEHTFCPDQIMGRGTTTHSFFIVSLRCLNFLLNEIVSDEQKAKEALAMIYTASMEKTKYTEEVTRPARLCIRVQVDAYIQCKASDLDLEANESWKQLDQGVTKIFCTSVKDEARRAALKTLLSTASKISRSNKRRGTETNPLEDASPSSSKSAKRPLDLKDNGLQDDDISPRSVVRQKMVPGGDGSGDTSEQNALDGNALDTSPDSVLPQPTCQGTPAAESLPGFNGILPRRPDALDASRQISTGHPQDKLCRIVRTCSSMLLQAHALGLLSIDERAMLVHITHESLKKDLKAVCEKKNDEMTAVSTLAGMRRRRVSES